MDDVDLRRFVAAHRVLFTQFVSLRRRRWSREEPLADVPYRPTGECAVMSGLDT